MVHYSFDIDGRSIWICYAGIDSSFLALSARNVDALNSKIVHACSDCPYGRLFSRINIIFCGIDTPERILPKASLNKMMSGGGIARCNPGSSERAVADGEIMPSENTLYVNAIHITDTASYFSDDNTDSRTAYIIHELTHLWHYQQSEYSHLINAGARLDESLSKLSTPAQDKFIDALVWMRQALFTYLKMLICEGAAQYVSHHYCNGSQHAFCEAQLVSGYTDAKELIDDIVKGLEMYEYKLGCYIEEPKGRTEYFKSIAELYELVHDCVTGALYVYRVGEHMIYSILFMDKQITLKELLSLSYIQIIKKYEECMHKKGFKPVVSYDSGKGMFDYAHWLKMLSERYEQAKRLGV